MPELPEVETTRRGIEPHLQGRRIREVLVRDSRLRWPVPADLPALLRGQQVSAVTRRAKYLLIALERGTVIVHLGMSGSLRVVSGNEAPRTHDHVELQLDDGRAVRLHDPRRFGSIHFTLGDPAKHRLLIGLGIEPLSPVFDGAVLRRAGSARRAAVKTLIMDARVVVGVGNIYASESLYLAGIHPARSSARIAAERYARLGKIKAGPKGIGNVTIYPNPGSGLFNIRFHDMVNSGVNVRFQAI